MQGKTQRTAGIMRSGAVAVLAAGGLAACATPMPTRLPGASIAQNGAQAPRSTAPHPGAQPGPNGRVPGTMRPYQIKGVWYYPAEQPDYDEVGLGSWYGEQFHNRTTSNGEVFDMDRITAAHKTLPLPSLVEVTNLANGRKLVLRVNDRGPFVEGRIIDLSRAAAEELGYRSAGVARVRVRYLGPAPKSPFEGQRYAQAPPPSAPLPIQAPAAAIRDQGFSVPAPQPSPQARFALADPRAYRVQAAAFANRDNAERAAALFNQAAIEPAISNGVEIYRVILGPAADEPAAWALRDLAASQGFADARVLRP